MATIPQSNADIASLGVRVVTNWASYPALTLSWITQADALTIVTDYNNLILQSAQAKGSKRAAIRTMQQLDDIINGNLYRLKLLIEMEYGKTRLPSYYAEFGLPHFNNRYALPVDRDARIQALRVLVSRLATAPFQSNTYGEAYWQDLLTQYEAAKTALETQAGQSSEKAMDKNLLKKEVVKLLKSIKHLIIAHYPDTNRGVLRYFGYHDELI